MTLIWVCLFYKPIMDWRKNLATFLHQIFALTPPCVCLCVYMYSPLPLLPIILISFQTLYTGIVSSLLRVCLYKLLQNGVLSYIYIYIYIIYCETEFGWVLKRAFKLPKRLINIHTREREREREIERQRW